MKSRTIILCSGEDEAVWSVRYCQNHPTHENIVIAPTIEAQLILKNNKIFHHSLYDLEQFDRNTKNEGNFSNPNVYKLSLDIVKSLKYKTLSLSLNIFGINMFDLLINNLAFIYADIVHNFRVYKKIINRWKPNLIFIPKDIKKDYYTSNIDNFFSLAVYIKFYFISPKIKIVEYKTIKKKSYHSIINKLISNTIQVKFLIQKAYFKFSKPVNKKILSRDTTIIMQTGGIIASYYYPLYKILANKFNFKLITYKLGLSQQIPLISRSIDFNDIETFWDRDLKNLYIQQNKLLLKKIDTLSNFKIRKLGRVEDRSLIKAILNQTVIYFEKNIARILRSTLLNQKIINKYKPKLIINSHDPGLSGSSFVLTSQKKRITSLLLLHGLFVESYLPEAYSDYIAVWGKKNYQYFLENSKRNSKNTFAVGFPGLDIYKNFSKYRRPSKQRVTAKNQIKIGLILSSYFPNDSFQARFFEEFFKSLSKFNRRIIIQFRLHEGFYIKSIDQIAKEYHVKIVDKSKSDLIEFIKESDLVICWDTTALIYVMLLGKPLIHTSPIWKKGVITPTQGYNAAWIPKDNIELERIIDRFLKNPKIGLNLIEGQNKFLEDYCGPVDGKSTYRIINLVDKLIRNKNI